MLFLETWARKVPSSHPNGILTWLYSSMRYSWSGVHLSRTGSRREYGTPPTSKIAADNQRWKRWVTAKPPSHMALAAQWAWELERSMWLTINVVFKNPDALLVQGHHFGEIGTLGTRVHLHLRIHSPSSESGFILFLGRVCCNGRKTEHKLQKALSYLVKTLLPTPFLSLPVPFLSSNQCYQFLVSFQRISKYELYFFLTNNILTTIVFFIYHILEIIPCQDIDFPHF